MKFNYLASKLNQQLRGLIAKLVLISSCSFVYLLPFSLLANGASKAHFVVSNEVSKHIVEGIRELEQKNLLDGKVVIAQGDQILFMAQNQELAQMQEEPQFMIASLSKQFFAAALLKLLYDQRPDLTEEKRIEYVKNQLTQPLNHFLPPEMAIWNGHIPKWAQMVTLHHLLSHTSGIANYTEAKAYSEVSESGKRFFEIPHAKSEIIHLICEEPMLFAPGSEFYYSNTNYVLIAEIIEVLSTLPASAYLQQTIFQPLSLTSTFNTDEGGAETLKKIPHLSSLTSQWQYDLLDKKANLYALPYNENTSNAIGSGSIISTTSDLLKWNLALHRDHSILPNSLCQLMVAPNREGYGYGIELATSDRGIVYRHRGIIDAYRSMLYYFPEQDLSIIILTSTNYDEEKIQREKEKIMFSFNDLLSPGEKEYEAMEQILERYPDKRGFNLIVDLIDSNFKIEFIN